MTDRANFGMGRIVSETDTCLSTRKLTTRCSDGGRGEPPSLGTAVQAKAKRSSAATDSVASGDVPDGIRSAHGIERLASAVARS